MPDKDSLKYFTEERAAEKNVIVPQIVSLLAFSSVVVRQKIFIIPIIILCPLFFWKKILTLLPMLAFCWLALIGLNGFNSMKKDGVLKQYMELIFSEYKFPAYLLKKFGKYE